MYHVYQTPEALLLPETPPFVVKGEHVVGRYWFEALAKAYAKKLNNEAREDN